MFGVTDLGAYVLGAFVIVLLPGPNSLYTLSVAARNGVRAGYQAATGVFIGDITLMVLSAAGAASLLQADELVYAVVRYTAGAYLAWLGLGMVRSAWRLWRERGTGGLPAASVEPGTERAARSGGAMRAGGAEPGEATAQAPGRGVNHIAPAVRRERPFRRALVVSLLNPKAILFFVSFFIQFVDPAYAYPALSFLLLGVIMMVFSALYLSTLIFAGTYLAGQFRRRRRLSAGLSSAVGALFMGFAAKLALSSAG